VKLGGRDLFRFSGVIVGALAAVIAAIRGEWWFAGIFLVAAVVLGISVIHQLRQAR
jgi:hypothetical protein